MMRIQFEIRERLHEIITEILQSEKWHVLVKEENENFKRITIKDPYFESEATIEIWEQEIHLRTAWSNYTYRIYQMGNNVWCEYIGAYRGLLEQTLLPRITPKENILDSIVTHSTLLAGEKETLRNYSNENVKHKKKRGEDLSSDKQHPQVVHDEFIKIGVPMPPL